MIEVNGTNLYYETAGEIGDPIVMVHGSWGDHLNWAPVVPGLSMNFRVVTYDRRGHSMSEPVTAQGSAEEDAMDAADLLNRLGMAPAHVVGNSFGAIISLKLAARQPSLFRSLTVHEPPLFGLLTDEPSVAPMAMEGMKRAQVVIDTLQTGDRAEGARLFVETLAFGPGQWEKLSPRIRETFVKNADTWLDETRDPMGSSLDLAALSKFRRPAIVTWGGKSPPFFKPIVERVARAIPGSKVEEYPADGHTPHLSNPNEFVSRVTAFAQSAG